MNVRPIRRRDPKHVTIAHISDLHFKPTTSFPRFVAAHGNEPAIMVEGDANLRELVRDLAAQKPDILAVTGDIADNPFSQALKELLVPQDERQLSEWNSSLTKTFADARVFLNEVCRVCGIEPAALFVIPGNHDFRLQGTYSGWGWKKKYQAESIASSFMQAFQGCGMEGPGAVVCYAPDAGDPTIILRLVCVDSNDTDAYLNFATGAVSQSNLEKIDRLNAPLPAIDPEPINPSVFRLCLVHHGWNAGRREYFRSRRGNRGPGVSQSRTDFIQQSPPAGQPILRAPRESTDPLSFVQRSTSCYSIGRRRRAGLWGGLDWQLCGTVGTAGFGGR